MKITLIYYNEKEKQIGGMILAKTDLKSPLFNKLKREIFLLLETQIL
jgi:hypothetical protein